MAEQVVELAIVDAVSHETLRKTLKKRQTPRKIRRVIPPEPTANCRCRKTVETTLSL